jgi:hypothetical protein
MAAIIPSTVGAIVAALAMSDAGEWMYGGEPLLIALWLSLSLVFWNGGWAEL